MIFSLVVGSMFLGLAYQSVFLSFLSFPPVSPIKDVAALATAIERGQYHCVNEPSKTVNYQLVSSKKIELQIIGKDILTNNLTKGDTEEYFHRNSKKQNIAALTNADYQKF